MEDRADIRKLFDSVRTSTTAKGRTYADTGVEPKWLAAEIAEHCKTKGWKSSTHRLPEDNAWLIVGSNIATLVEGTSGSFAVKVSDLRPVRLKTALAFDGLLALTGGTLVALPLAAFAIWRSKSRAAKVDSILQFVDERVRHRMAKANVSPPVENMADRMTSLATLREQGLITPEEYEAKRQDLLRAL